MNTFDVLRSAVAPRKARIDREPVRQEPRVDDTAAEQRAERARFAKVLALLAGTSEKTRVELLRQMPEGNASLIDKLLEEAGEADNGNPDIAAELRYGMIPGDLNVHKTDKGTIDVHGLQGIARASRHGNLETLARIAARRGSSVEELLALGDSKTADLKSALEALLARAGTPDAIALVDGEPISDAALVAHAVALENARAKSAADVTTPVNDSEALSPEFRARLDRVIERMKNEYGHDVQLVETARSQERQDHLYEQGRTRGGPVVTWTRDSAHLTGDAADVVIDGKWNSAEGFARLQSIAREEGLRTLGMRDPGHLELPREARMSLSANALAQAKAAFTSSNSNTATDVATGNGIARVASVAGVASVAQVGVGVRQLQSSENAAKAGDSSSSNMTIPAEAKTNDQAGSDAGSNNTDKRESERGPRPESDNASPAFGVRGPVAAANLGSAAAERAASPAGAAAFDRVLEAQRIRDAAPARPVSQLTLQVDAPNGRTDEITIGMRGNSVNTQILTDAQNAERLRMRTGELQDALTRHGLESDSVRITGTTNKEGVDAAKGLANATERDALKAGVAQQSQHGEGFTNNGQRDRTASARDWQERQEARRERDEQRQSDSERQRRGPFNPESK